MQPTQPSHATPAEPVVAVSLDAPSLTRPGGVAARLWRVRGYFPGAARALPLVLLATVLVALTEPAMPALMQPLLDQGFQGTSFSLWLVPAALIGLFAVRGLAGFAGQYALAWLANEGLVRLRLTMFARLQSAHPSIYASHSASSLANTMVYEAQNGSSLLVYALISLVRDVLTVLALLAYLLYVNWRLTLIVLLVFPAVAWVMKLFARRLHRISLQTQAETDRLAYVIEENVLAHRVVRLHAAQASQAQRFASLSADLRRLSIKSAAATAAATPVTQLLASVALSAVICAALWQSSAHGVTVGGFAAFVTAMLMLVAPMRRLADSASPIARGLVAIERAVDFVERTPSQPEGTHSPDRTRGEIVLERVSVSYPGTAEKTLDEVSLRIAPGETVALVGASGAGKSTLANLLPRFVDASTGRVLLDGVDVREWRLDALMRQLAYVSQDVVMFNDTIAANVALGAPVDRARVLRALTDAHLDELVAQLPGGMDARVGHNASQLSGGQRQRLAIARALYKDAPVLILDEATSALDNASERLIKDALSHAMKGRTTLVIAHRLSTIEHADRIVVMQAGRIVETGTHAELMGRAGVYAALLQGGAALGASTS